MSTAHRRQFLIVTSSTPRSRRWAKTGATQRRILDAATEVFATNGFAAATIADMVTISGASIGSIYHHFGGKSELFQAIFDEFTGSVHRRVQDAMEQACEVRSDRRRLFELQVKTCLEAIRENRLAARVMASGDMPPGFDVARRSLMTAACRSWMKVLELESSPRGELLSRVLINTVTESAAMVAECDDPAIVQPIIDAANECIVRLTE